MTTSKSAQRRRVQVQALLLAATAASSFAFVPNSNNINGGGSLAARVDIFQRTGQTPPSSTALPMVLDFFRQRAEEGVDQAKKLADAAAKGKFGEGLVDAAAYTKQTNEAFATGLAKSRNKLLYGLESAFSGGGDILEELEDVLLQADLGLSTAEDVMSEVKSLREDSTQIFSRDDIRSILRGKLIEALEVEGDRRIRFEGISMYQDEQAKEIEGKDENTGIANEGKESRGIPTVLFVMGANGEHPTYWVQSIHAAAMVDYIGILHSLVLTHISFESDLIFCRICNFKVWGKQLPSVNLLRDCGLKVDKRC